jgi:Uma2 family endonuclease
MAGAKVVHNRITSNVLIGLGSGLRGKPCEPFNSDMKVRVSMQNHIRFYYPDAMVVCDSNPDNDMWQERPRVIVEVASASTRRTDEGEKREAYCTLPSLAVYLLVDSARPRVVAYRRVRVSPTGPGAFEPELHEGLDAVVSLNEVGTSLPLAKVYDRVDFASAAEAEADDVSG